MILHIYCAKSNKQHFKNKKLFISDIPQCELSESSKVNLKCRTGSKAYKTASDGSESTWRKSEQFLVQDPLDYLQMMFYRDEKFKKNCCSSKRPTLRMFMNSLVIHHIGNIVLVATSIFNIFYYCIVVDDIGNQILCSNISRFLSFFQVFSWCIFQILGIFRSAEIIYNRHVSNYFCQDILKSIKNWIKFSLSIVIINIFVFLPMQTFIASYEWISIKKSCHRTDNLTNKSISILVSIGIFLVYICNFITHEKLLKNMMDLTTSNTVKQEINITIKLTTIINMITSTTTIIAQLCIVILEYRTSHAFLIFITSFDVLIRIILTGLVYKFRYLWIFPCVNIIKDYCNEKNQADTVIAEIDAALKQVDLGLNVAN